MGTSAGALSLLNQTAAGDPVVKPPVAPTTSLLGLQPLNTGVMGPLNSDPNASTGANLSNSLGDAGQAMPAMSGAPGTSTNSSLLGVQTPAQTPPTTTPGPQLDTTPDAGAKINGGNYYNDQAIGAVRDYFNLWNNDQFTKDTAALDQQLRNRGIKPGDPSYNTELQKLRDEQGKLRESSNLQAVNAGQQEAANMQGMDINAETSNLNRQLGVAGNTRADQAQKDLEQKYSDDKTAGIVGQGVSLLDKSGILPAAGNAIVNGAKSLFGLGGDNSGVDTSAISNAQAGALSDFNGGGSGGGSAVGEAGGLLGLGKAAGSAYEAAGGGLSGVGAGISAGVNTLTGGLTTGVGTAIEGGISSALSSAYAALGSMGPIGWAGAAALAAGTAIAASQPKSSPLNNFNAKTGGWTTTGENFSNTKFTPQELNAYYGPAIQTFISTKGDTKAALSALPQPTNDHQKLMLQGMLHLFSGTGNPFRQIAKANGWPDGAYTAGSPQKAALIKELGLKT